MKQYKLSEIDTLNPFNCGDEDLNDFLLNDARFYDEQMLAHTYVFIDGRRDCRLLLFVE